MVPCTGESPPTGQVAKEGNFASRSSNKLRISTINRLNLREAEQLKKARAGIITTGTIFSPPSRILLTVDTVWQVS
jgi:hypothetical protein